MKTILVTGAGGSAGCNFIRSLRLAPEPFYIIGTDISKYYIKLSKADKNYLVPPSSDKGYLKALNDIISAEHIDFLHCQPDPEVAVLCKNKNRLLCRTFLPSPDEVSWAHDKFLFNVCMETNRVPVPQAWLVNSRQDLKTVFKKERKVWLRATVGAGSLAALPVTTEEQAGMWIDYWTSRGIGWGKFMISDYLPGKEYAFQSIWKDGYLVTSAARERIEYLFQNRMPSGQSSTPTIAKSVHNELVNQVATQAIMALSQNRAHGVYCVDLKENENGIPCVTEINLGRFFTTSLFFSTLGSNMPYLSIKIGMGERIPCQPKYNAVPKDFYWIRQIDCSEALVSEKDING